MTKQAKEAAAIIRKRAPNFVPKVGMILGSGLGAVSDQIKDPITISYNDLPGFKVTYHGAVSKVEGHASKLHLGMLKGVPVACLEGRAHTYEGGDSLEVIKTLIRTLKLIGCTTLLTTNAVGSLRKEVGPGSLVAISDHINFMFSNILIGINDDEFGERFVSMDNVYDKELREKILAVAKKHKIPLHQGVYLATSGPTFESHAEIRMFKALGADTVGMSTVPEVIVARHCGMKVASISAITNMAAGLSDEVLSHEGTLKGAALAVQHMANLFLAILEEGVVK
jgi:xanthosine phosphorylase